jgi:hypothetical protein
MRVVAGDFYSMPPRRKFKPSFLGKDPATLTAVELNAFVPMKDAEELSSLSEDTLRKNFPELIVQLSPGRVGIRLHHVLRLPAPVIDST